MNSLSNQEKPIYVQIREKIEDQIVNNQLHEGEQAPSTNQLAAFYKINHITVSKGVNQLVDEGILYKKRGIGMFVAEGAKEKLISKRKATFKDVVIVELVLEAEKLGISESEIVEYIKQVKGRMQSDNGN
ncbi:GntR family transcriptional regulator [Bacillus sp. Bva_UNVM-123]|uniref:GntR family transcriptional regulator n=1 Tax=Bacillus sp. Bva_UNVM-123 TaxID=2829798 RepID=UPI00391FC027